MEQESQFISMVSSVDPHSLPLVVVIVIAYLYFTFHKVETDCFETKQQRDTDSQNLHDDVLKLKFKVNELDGRTVHHADVLEDLRTQVATLNANISKLTIQLEYPEVLSFHIVSG